MADDGSVSGNEPKYPLPHGLIESCRLNYQFYLWKDVLGFNIHPSISLSITDRPVIADIATGTAIWLIDESRRQPASATLHGFDVDLSSVPNRALLPSNVQVSEWNFFEDPPADFRGKYDLVHVRLLVAAMPRGADDVKPVLQRLKTMLKPGGALQWDDLEIKAMRIHRATEDIKSPAIDALLQSTMAQAHQHWTSELAEMVEGEGFDDVKLFKYDDKSEIVPYMGEIQLLTLLNVSNGLAAAGKLTESQLLNKAVHASLYECKQGVTLTYPKVVVVARRP